MFRSGIHRFVWRSVALAATTGLALIACGRAAQADTAPPSNTIVTDSQIFSYAMPWIGADPANPAHFVVSYQLNRAFTACKIGLSNDGGATWRNVSLVGSGPGALYPFASGVDRCVRPSLAYGPNGELVVAFSESFPQPVVPPATSAPPYLELFVMVSKDGGATFSAPARLDPAEPPPSDPNARIGDQNVKLAIDNHTGRVYAAWERIHDGFTPIAALVASSTDGGNTFSTPVQVNPSTQDGYLAYPAVAPNGVLYVGYLDNFPFTASSGANPINVMVAGSHDNGQHFGAPVVAEGLSSKFCPPLNACQKDPQGQFVFNPGFSIAAGAANEQVFVAGSGLDGDVFRMHVTASTDGGTHWTAPKTVGTAAGPATDSQLVPSTAVSPSGRLDVVYYDLAEPSGLENTFLISSSDGGGSFSSPRQISSASSNVAIGASFPNEPFTVGNLVVSTNAGAFMAWTDSRRGTVDSGKLDIEFATTVTAASPSATAAAPVPATGVGPSPWALLLLAAASAFCVATLYWVRSPMMKRSRRR